MCFTSETWVLYCISGCLSQKGQPRTNSITIVKNEKSQASEMLRLLYKSYRIIILGK